MLMMNVEEALEIVESVLEQGRLNKVQETVFRQSWEGASYGAIARISGYDTGYIKDTGCHLWQALSKAFGYKVTKNNFQTVLQRRSFVRVSSLIPSTANGNGANGKSVGADLQQIKLITRSPAPVEGSTNQRCDWGGAGDVSIFYGRAAELTTLVQVGGS